MRENSGVTVQRTSPRKRRRKKKGNPIIGVASLLVAILLIFFACSIGGSDDKDSDVASTAPSVESSESVAEASEPQEKPEKTEPKITEEELVATIQKTLDESGIDGTVTLEDNLLVVTAYNDDILSDLLAAMMGDENALSAWDRMKGSFAMASGNLRQSAVAAGFNDVHASIMLANPQNKENSILITMDDAIFYDGMQELRESYEKTKN